MEEFLDIPGCEGFYQINRAQQVRSLDRELKHRNGKMYIRKGRIRKPVTDSDGYYRISISIKGKTKIWGLHRLMAITFIANTDNKSTVNHKNGIKTDNSIENLEWCSVAENNLHAYATGLKKKYVGKDHWNTGKIGPMAGKSGEQLKTTKIIIDIYTGIFYYGCREAAEAKGININNLRGMLAGFIKNRSGLIYAQ